jgi:hypothetical protein
MLTLLSIHRVILYNLDLCIALLGIKPSDNNGTFGSLYHMLKEDLIGRLPPGTHSVVSLLLA